MSGLAGKRRYIYAASVRGYWQRVHRVSGVLLQVLLFATPWLMVGGHPALQLDLPHRRLTVLGQFFGPTDTIFLVLIGLFLAFSLFFVTAFFGRLWCGFLCPQTVFLEEWVRRIEIKIEGERGQRRARDEGPWTPDKAWRKALKWSAFALLAGFVSMTLVSYFSGARALWGGSAGTTSYAFVGVLSVVFFLDFSWFREQFCIYLCPYARFQGALTDDHSLVIGYDAARGEPRRESGACIDCDKCVVVCPTGIDIRDGYQLECISCARCIDACHSVMEKRHTLPSLVQYTTQARAEGRPARKMRGRTFAYGGLLLSISVAFLVLVHDHHSIEVKVNRATGTLFTVDPDGGVRNTYLLHITNNHPDTDGAPDPFHVTVLGLPGAEVSVQDLKLDENASATVPLIVRVAQPLGLDRTVPIQVHVSSPGDEVAVPATFKSGGTLSTPGT